MEWIFNNKEWLFSGVGVVFFSLFANKILKSRNKNTTSNVLDANATQSNNTNVSNSNTVNISLKEIPVTKIKTVSHKDKEDIQILFIDDEKFEIANILKGAGWTNTKTIRDVKNLDCVEVKNADVLFVDINGVGCNLFPKDQGLGLAEAIKSRAPEKYIVIYSAQEQRLHKAFSIVDAVLPKNAEPYEFINILENYLRNKK